MYNWNHDWREELKEENPKCYERFCDCKNNRRDLKIMAKLMYKYNPTKSKEDCLDKIIDWITGANNQVHLVPDEEEYQKLLECL